MAKQLYHIVYGSEKEHAANLHAGLMLLGPDFYAKVCPICQGEGQHEQLYTAGCGGGYFKSMGGCDYCEGHGLLQGTKPAPSSVVVQVVNAGQIFLGRKS